MAESPWVMTAEEFVCGAEGAEAWTEQHFDDYINDIDKAFAPDGLIPVEGHPDYFLGESSDSTLLIHRAVGGQMDVVGYYNTPGAVCIKDEHQGKGLGAELILFTALHWSGGPPTEGLDEQCFSEAGYGAHLAAYRLGVRRGAIVASAESDRGEQGGSDLVEKMDEAFWGEFSAGFPEVTTGDSELSGEPLAAMRIWLSGAPGDDPVQPVERGTCFYTAAFLPAQDRIDQVISRGCSAARTAAAAQGVGLRLLPGDARAQLEACVRHVLYWNFPRGDDDEAASEKSAAPSMRG